MKEFFRRLWVIFRKEMTHCYRDPHVVIYGVLFPLLFYPATAIIMLEIGIFQEGVREKEVYRLYFPPEENARLTAIKQLLKGKKRSTFVASDNPDKDLKDGKLDAIFVASDNVNELPIKVAGTITRSASAKNFIAKTIETARIKSIADELKGQNLDPVLTKVFTYELKDTSSVAGEKKDGKDGNAAHVIFRYLLASIVCVLVLCIPAGAVYPAICAFTEEREKKTLESTLVAPVSTECLMFGKFLSVFVVAFSSGMLNLLGMSLVIMLMFSQAKGMGGKLAKLSTTNFSVSPETALCLFAATVLFSILVSAIFSLLGAMTKSFKEAQNILTIPLLLFTPLPIAGMLPGVLLTQTLAFVPVLNLILWVKAAVRGDAEAPLVAIAIVETLLIVTVLLWLLNRLIRTEKFVLGEHGDIWKPVFARGKTNGR